MALENNVFRDWVWVGRYVAVMVLSVVLAAALGHMQLFEQTTIGGKLAASHIVEFLGFGAALAVLWMLGQRVTIAIQKLGGKWATLQDLILPVVTLVVVALAYSVVLLLLKPFMGTTAASIFNWVFIVAILACSGWLIMAVFNQTTPLTAMLTGKRKKAK